MAALSLDLRKRIVAAFDRGGRKRKEVAELFSVSAGTVSKLLRQRRDTGDLSPRYSYCKGKPKILAADEQRLRELIASKPDMTLTELRDGAGLSCTIQAVHYALGRMGMTFKKTLRASEQDPKDIAAARKKWKRWRHGLDPSRLVFIDESGAKTNMTRFRGRSPRGERLHASAPCRRWESTTMISSVARRHHRLHDGGGAANTEAFRAYVSEVLLPTLREGDLVVMDNLGAHKNALTVALIETAGAKAVFLPACSPDLNPIGMMWSKVKSILRKLEARDNQALLAAIATALSTVTATDAMGCFSHCGYNFI